LGFTKAYAQRGYKVFAGVLDAIEMKAVEGLENVVPVKLDQSTLTDAKEASPPRGLVSSLLMIRK
jgi:hypothetical protein